MGSRGIVAAVLGVLVIALGVVVLVRAANTDAPSGPARRRLRSNPGVFMDF